MSSCTSSIKSIHSVGIFNTVVQRGKKRRRKLQITDDVARTESNSLDANPFAVDDRWIFASKLQIDGILDYYFDEFTHVEFISF